jgi:hypothetical protein
MFTEYPSRRQVFVTDNGRHKEPGHEIIPAREMTPGTKQRATLSAKAWMGVLDVYEFGNLG